MARGICVHIHVYIYIHIYIYIYIYIYGIGLTDNNASTIIGCVNATGNRINRA